MGAEGLRLRGRWDGRRDGVGPRLGRRAGMWGRCGAGKAGSVGCPGGGRLGRGGDLLGWGVR